MKYYYYALNDQKFGPFSYEELKVKRLTKDSFVWTDGMSDWQPAGSIEELKEILIPVPPPLPPRDNNKTLYQATSSSNQISKYDLTYQREFEYTIIGLFLLILLLAIQYNHYGFTGNAETRTYFILGLLVLRIFVTFRIIKVAAIQNRNTYAWGWFAFVLPVVALIVIGLLKKLRIKN